jgi:hypothetical protein
MEEQGKRAKRTTKRAGRSLEPRLSYKVEVTDKDGRVVQREEGPSHSYVRQWSEILHLQAGAIYIGGGGTVKMTDGSTESNAYYSVRSFASNAGIGVDRSGLRVGKDSTPVSINDYALGAPIAEGTGLDQLEHQLTYFTGSSVAGSVLSFTMQRSFVNHSGATISGIQEIGNYIEFTGSMLGRVALGFRDVLGSSFSIPDGGAITVTYTLKVMV